MARRGLVVRPIPEALRLNLLAERDAEIESLRARIQKLEAADDRELAKDGVTFTKDHPAWPRVVAMMGSVQIRLEDSDHVTLRAFPSKYEGAWLWRVELSGPCGSFEAYCREDKVFAAWERPIEEVFATPVAGGGSSS